ncbi:MAG: hypothetical protein ACSHWQ_01285, partial [Spongiibacteraceae bacterium]
LRARYEAITQVVKAHAKSMGVDNLTPSQIDMMPSVRVAVLGDDAALGGEHYERELASLPAMQEARKRAETKAALEAGNESELAKLDNMTGAQKINYAREHGLTGTSPRETMTADDEAARLRMINTLNPQARIAAWRAMEAEKTN